MEINRIIQKYKKILISNFFIASNVMVCGFLLIMIFFISFAWKAATSIPAQAHIAGANTIAYWPMTEDAGNIINDKIGTPLNIALGGSSAVGKTLFWVTGAANNGLQIRGDLYPGEYTYLDSYPTSNNKIVNTVKAQNKFRIDLWLKADNITQNVYLFSIKNDVSPYECDVCIKQEGADLVFIVSNNHGVTYYPNEVIIRMAGAIISNTVTGFTFTWDGVAGQYIYNMRLETGSVFNGTGPLPGGAGSNISNWNNASSVFLGFNGTRASPAFGNYFFGTFYQVAVSIDTPDMPTGNSKSTDHDGDGRIDVNFGGTDCNDQLVDEPQCNITPGVPASCKNAGDLNGECQSCNPLVSRTGWTNRWDFSQCDADTNGCTAVDYCLSGTCTAGSPPGCNDGINCTRNDCVPVVGDPVNYSCKYDVVDVNWCKIGSTGTNADCYWSGSINSLNSCQWCDVSISNTAWTNYSAPPQACYTGSATTRNVGACKDGSQTCVSGAWSACMGQTLPATEICDNIDNDCVGGIDNGLTRSTTCGAGACANTVNQTCAAGAWGPACTPLGGSPEVCDNIDNDCVGGIDNGLTRSTTCGAGACLRTANQTCTAGVWGPLCTPGAAGVETCNNIDDDCDGAVDDNLTQPATCGVGECANTITQTCTAGIYGPVCSPKPAGIEVCDAGNKDEDCDGLSNEGCLCIDGTTQPKTCGVGACFKSITQTCTAGAWGPLCTPGAAGVETCNNIDDDCVGGIDNGLTRSTTCGAGACANTVNQTCAAGAWGPACTPLGGSPEICDNIDNDCVGGIDNGLTQSQTCGTGACLRTANQTCTAGVWSPTCTPGAPIAEICDDGVDNDCDYKIDGADEDCKLINFPVAIINAPFNTKRGKFIFVFENQPNVSISASRSYDPNGKPITFSWTQTLKAGDPLITINNATSDKISFTAPAGNTSLDIGLTVTNTAGLSAKNKVTVVVSEDCR